ncbi:hypothetical protein [Nocardia sp. NPDC057353]|uniref:hypothetical protein n=1 Tax=Nocardia sp. NPDC057353 TaxID=3346104 RepID=UPI003624EDD3
MTATPDYRELVTAVIGPEVADAGLDDETVRRIEAGEIDDWLAALAGSGLFDKPTLAGIGARWRSDPRLLVELLLEHADDLTRRRLAALRPAGGSRASRIG